MLYLDNFNIKNIRLSPPVSFDVESSLVLKNPNPISMELKNLDFDVFINDKKATHIAQSKETKIPAMSEFSVPIAFPVTFIDNAFFSDIGSVLISGITGNKLKIKFKGTLLVKAWGFEKENEFEYTYELFNQYKATPEFKYINAVHIITFYYICGIFESFPENICHLKLKRMQQKMPKIFGVKN